MERTDQIIDLISKANQLFDSGVIRDGQKLTREALKLVKLQGKIPNKLKHKLNATVALSRYFDDISSFATNPKRDELVSKIKEIADKPLENPRKQADEIHKIQALWQSLDQTSKTASQKQWSTFRSFIDKAWLPCGEFFDELNKQKLDNATKKQQVTQDLIEYVERNNKFPVIRILRSKLRKFEDSWNSYAPVRDDAFRKLKSDFIEAKKPILDEIKKQNENIKLKKEQIIESVLKLNSEDMEENITKYMYLKKDWNILEKLPHKIERVLWKKFIASGDRFFEEQNKNKQIQLDELVLAIKDIKKYDTSHLQEMLTKFELINKSKEYKILQNQLIKLRKDEKDKKNKNAIKDLEKLYEYIIGKKDISELTNLDSSYKEISSYKFNSPSEDEMLESCIRIEMICGVESTKKDEKVRSKVQLKLLNEKFNKAKLTKKEEIIMNIKNFFLHISPSKAGTVEKNLWKRIIKATKPS
tara:strand:+ start:2121 stop:3536 length:1416 start_codon:yes stop_codon:yes gene_type:complete